jgi:putative oxidoreductase
MTFQTDFEQNPAWLRQGSAFDGAESPSPAELRRTSSFSAFIAGNWTDRRPTRRSFCMCFGPHGFRIRGQFQQRETVMRSWFYNHTDLKVSTGLLVLRLVVGAAFLFHGWSKIQSPLAWMGQDAAVPGFLQALAAVAEFGGGIALILGLLTRLACLGIGATMIAALAIVHLPQGDPFVGQPGESSYELAAVYLACVILVLLAGPGRFSIDALLFRTPREINRDRETRPARAA